MEKKDIEIPFGAYDSELDGFEYTIPEGYEAEIRDGKIVVRKIESEDERIRKAIIEIVKKDEERIGTNAHLKKIQWLEKQGEHANFLDKIQVGDKVTRNEDGVLVNLSQLKRVVKRDEKQGEHDMGISEATKQKLEDNLNKALEKETAESFNKFLDEQKPAETEKGAKGNDREIPNSIWSEEDEDVLDALIRKIEGEDIHVSPHLAVNWLKSIKDRYTWKPSDEQMNALNYVVNLMASSERPTENDLYYNILKSLRQQLMKLKG